MGQSANPAARVRHYTRTISMSIQNASIWSLIAAAPSDSVFRVLCINVLTYLLTPATQTTVEVNWQSRKEEENGTGEDIR